jgi:hypothetical protein
MDDTLRDLIDRDVDGEVPKEESLRLGETLSRDPEAAAYRADVARVAELLQAVPPASPPADLKHDIMSRIHTEHRRVVKRKKWYEPILEAVQPPRLRTGFFFAGGAALGLFAAWLALGGTALSPGAEYTVVGTMGLDVRDLSGFDKWETELSGGSVSIETKQGSGFTVAEVLVRSDSKVSITLELDPARVRTLGYTSRGRGPVKVEVEGSRFVLTPFGETRVIVLLEPKSAAGSVIGITLDEGGRLRDGKLKAPGLAG